ncbi:MAG: sulfotransferase family protein [Chloroflexi bacterium]|nr:sulfotransferase family protein [Chloroflexota bacterium]
MPELSHSARENVIFLHLPKTAGSTINFILNRQYAPEVIYTIEGDTLSALKEFEQLSSETRAKIRLFKGHGEYGIHNFLQGDSKYFTFLRNPVERIISEYYFILRAPKTPYYQHVTQNNLGLKEVVESENPLIMMHNSQTIILAGAWRAGIKECTDEILNQAKRNLREHFIVGLTEKFDDSLCLLKNYFQWNNFIFYKKANVSLNRPTRETIPQDAMDAILRTNQYDLELYQYAQTLFAEQIEQQGLFFPASVSFFQFFNKVLNYTKFLQLPNLWHRVKNR